uniref:AIG1-type G domain-containing protein n=1 Tax=Amphilophus citrinellus TaxID=61819 RepID=A0A3Q0RH00_AMPCI
MKKAEADLRIVLGGKTRAGKSASGNTILRGKVFKSTSSSSSSVTSECQKETSQFEGQTLAVVDTPGLYETKLTEKEVKREINRCISFAAPGPHVFLVVIEPNRFTEEEHKTMKIIQNIFGEEAARYTMALITHEDDLTEENTIEEVISKHRGLSNFISQCGGGYHIFNNRSKDPSQVRELLKKINTMIEKNGGSCYTADMFEKAEKAIKKEMERLQNENQAMTDKEVRAKAERRNEFTQESRVAAIFRAAAAAGAGVGIGTRVGVRIGAVWGPVGAAVGGTVGIGVGLAVDAVRLKMKPNDCVTQ